MKLTHLTVPAVICCVAFFVLLFIGVERRSKVFVAARTAAAVLAIGFAVTAYAAALAEAFA